MATCLASDLVFRVSNWRNEGEQVVVGRVVAAALCAAIAVVIALVEAVVYAILAFLTCHLDHWFRYSPPFHHTCDLLYDTTLLLRQVGRCFYSNFAEEKMAFWSRHPVPLLEVRGLEAPESLAMANLEVVPQLAYALCVSEEALSQAPGRAVYLEELEEKIGNKNPQGRELLEFFDQVEADLRASDDPNRIAAFLRDFRDFRDFQYARINIERYEDVCRNARGGVDLAARTYLLGLVLLLREADEELRYEIMFDLVILPNRACEGAVYDRSRELYERYAAVDLESLEERLKLILQPIKRDYLDARVNANVHQRNAARIAVADDLGLDVTFERQDPYVDLSGRVILANGRVGGRRELLRLFKQSYTSEQVIYEVKVRLNRLFESPFNNNFRLEILSIIGRQLQERGCFDDLDYSGWVDENSDPQAEITKRYMGTIYDNEGDGTHYITDGGVALLLIHLGVLRERA